MYRWHAQQHFGPKAKGHGQCQGGSTSLCLPKCGAVVHFGCHYYERFRSEISGDYFAAGREHGHGSGWWLAFIPSRSSGLLIELIQAILASNA